MLALVSARTGKPLKPCGTDAAYLRHRRRGEPIDAACRAAHSKASMIGYKERRIARQELARMRRAATEQALQSLVLRHVDEFDSLYSAALRDEIASTAA